MCEGRGVAGSGAPRSRMPSRRGHPAPGYLAALQLYLGAAASAGRSAAPSLGCAPRRLSRLSPRHVRSEGGAVAPLSFSLHSFLSPSPYALLSPCPNAFISFFLFPLSYFPIPTFSSFFSIFPHTLLSSSFLSFSPNALFSLLPSPPPLPSSLLYSLTFPAVAALHSS